MLTGGQPLPGKANRNPGLRAVPMLERLQKSEKRRKLGVAVGAMYGT